MPEAQAQDRSNRFLLLYALAWAGGAIAYTPLLTILLPVKVAAQAGQADGVEWLALIALVGAIAASVGGILFGYLSDVSRNRRGWILAGMLLSSLLLAVIGRAEGLGQLVAAILAWQLALNMMLGPLAAWAGDRVPDSAKGLLGGLMAFAPVMGALAGVIVTHPALPQGADSLMLVAMMVTGCIMPALLWQPAHGRQSMECHQQGKPDDLAERQPIGRAVLIMWLARLSVQVAEATLFAYLFFWLRSIDPEVGGHQTARLFGAVMLGSVPVALAAGRWSDRTDSPILPLGLCAAGATAGLLAMAFASTLSLAVAAFALFGLSSAVFLSLHAAQTLRILPNPRRRGRDLGMFNLANTVPSLLMPPLAVTLVPLFGFSGLFLCLAGLAAAASLLLLTVAWRG